MESKSNFRQLTVYDAPTKGYYTVDLPEAEGPVTVAGFNGIAVAKQLSTLFPGYQFIYEKDSAYIYDAKVDRLVRDREASQHALISNGLALLEETCYQIRRELTLAEDEKRTPEYTELTTKLVSAFNSADKYFWILESREGKPKAAPAKSPDPKLKLRPPVWPKPSSDYDGDADWTSKYHKDIIAKGLTKHTLPFGVGYSFDGDINDIEKLTKELEGIFKGFRR